MMIVGVLACTFCMLGCIYCMRWCLVYFDTDIPCCLRGCMRPIPHSYKYYIKKKMISQKEFSSEDILYSQKECSICIEPFVEKENITVLRCHHVFHVGCVSEWINRKNDQSILCPVCKHDLREVKEVSSPNSTEIEMLKNKREDSTLSPITTESANLDESATEITSEAQNDFLSS